MYIYMYTYKCVSVYMYIYVHIYTGLAVYLGRTTVGICTLSVKCMGWL